MADSWQLSELSDSPRAWPLVLTYMCFFKTHVFFLLFVCFKGSPPKKEKHIEVSMSNTWIRPNLSDRKKKNPKNRQKNTGRLEHHGDLQSSPGCFWRRKRPMNSEPNSLPLAEFSRWTAMTWSKWWIQWIPHLFLDIMFWKNKPKKWWFHWGQAGKSAGLEDLICVLRFFWR